MVCGLSNRSNIGNGAMQALLEIRWVWSYRVAARRCLHDITMSSPHGLTWHGRATDRDLMEHHHETTACFCIWLLWQDYTSHLFLVPSPLELIRIYLVSRMSKAINPKKNDDVSSVLMVSLLFLVHTFTNSLFLSPVGGDVRCLFWWGSIYYQYS